MLLKKKNTYCYRYILNLVALVFFRPLVNVHKGLRYSYLKNLVQYPLHWTVQNAWNFGSLSGRPVHSDTNLRLIQMSKLGHRGEGEMPELEVAAMGDSNLSYLLLLSYHAPHFFIAY